MRRFGMEVDLKSAKTYRRHLKTAEHLQLPNEFREKTVECRKPGQIIASPLISSEVMAVDHNYGTDIYIYLLCPWTGLG